MMDGSRKRLTAEARQKPAADVLYVTWYLRYAVMLLHPGLFNIFGT
jgi:hypothetical protein